MSQNKYIWGGKTPNGAFYRSTRRMFLQEKVNPDKYDEDISESIH